ncbi:MAG: ABC transporter substrate-binding protein, partial [Desulfobulbaceae bacterium]|nr:ABC transporter substrate-binding protein [Desulfobulbaceae bacterium]
MINLQLRHLFHITLMLLAVICLLGCEKNQTKKQYKIGIISLNKNHQVIIDNFKQQMKIQGYIEGQDITYFDNGTLNSPAQVEPAVKDMITQNVDIIWTLTTPATKITKKILKDSPITILFAPVFCPLKSGIVNSLADTGGNITGVKVRGLSGKALELFIATVPSVRKILIPYHPTDFASTSDLKDLQESATKMQINIIAKKVTSNQELDNILSNNLNNIDALWITHGNLIRSNTQKLISAGLKSKIPIGSSSSLNSAVLLSYSISPTNLGKQAARMANKILKDTPIEKLPIETAEYFLGI